MIGVFVGGERIKRCVELQEENMDKSPHQPSDPDEPEIHRRRPNHFSLMLRHRGQYMADQMAPVGSPVALSLAMLLIRCCEDKL
jgi:hypothetical protein